MLPRISDARGKLRFRQSKNMISRISVGKRSSGERCTTVAFTIAAGRVKIEDFMMLVSADVVYM